MESSADFDNDGPVDITDVAIVASYYGQPFQADSLFGSGATSARLGEGSVGAMLLKFQL